MWCRLSISDCTLDYYDLCSVKLLLNCYIETNITISITSENKDKSRRLIPLLACIVSSEASGQNVCATVTGCRLDFLLRKWNISYIHLLVLVTKQSVASSSTTQHALPSEFGGKWGKYFIESRVPNTRVLVPSFYNAMCEIYRDAKKRNYFLF